MTTYAERREASIQRMVDAVAVEARRVAHRQVKILARRYVRPYHLSKATGVLEEYCGRMPNAEAIRRLTEAWKAARASYLNGAHGAIWNSNGSRAELLEIKAALLCERLARARSASMTRRVYADAAE